jgi:hypothetical protein
MSVVHQKISDFRIDRKNIFSENRSRSPDLAGDSIISQNTVSTNNRTQTQMSSRIVAG